MSNIAWSAGEASGDLIAGPVVAELGTRSPSIEQAGIGGPRMFGAGLQRWADIDELSVRGYAEVIKELPRLLRLRKRIAQQVRQWPASLFVGVDAPDFNLALARRLRRGGMRTVHFVGPSVWAWRAKRLRNIAASVDHMLLVFPFEKPLYDTAGIAATYVGHPLADALNPALFQREAARQRLGIAHAKPIVCVMPGSRLSEVAYMGELFVDAACWMAARDPALRFVLPAANLAIHERLQSILSARAGAYADRLELVQGQAHDAIAASQSVLVASGTATLEVALLGRPMVIAYRMSPISYQIMRRMALQAWIGLPNILCQESIVPEIIQDAATPSALGSAILDGLEPNKAEQVSARLQELRASMAIGCAQRAADVILDQAHYAH